MKAKATLAAIAAAAAVTFGAIALPGGAALAHEARGAGKPAAAAKKEQQPWGIAGNARDARRTIDIAMTDDMRFTPSSIEVREGETVRFVLHNKGKVVHEMVIGTKAALDEHAALMQKFPKMEHDEPHMLHVSAGKKGDLVWNFNRPGEFEFACLIPGHFQSGMVGKIKVVANGSQNGRKE